MRRTILDDPRYYLNRYVQWMDFNHRVLEEACDPRNPLLERVKFLTITANNLKPLFVAPRDLAKNCIALIDREARNAKRGKPSRIIAKVNALVDPPVIQALYRASQAGVEIDLIVRGQCALVPGLRGVSSHIRVRKHRRKIFGA